MNITDDQWLAFERYALARLEKENAFTMGAALWRETFGYEMPHYQSMIDAGLRHGPKFHMNADGRTLDRGAILFECSRL